MKTVTDTPKAAARSAFILTQTLSEDGSVKTSVVQFIPSGYAKFLTYILLAQLLGVNVGVVGASVIQFIYPHISTAAKMVFDLLHKFM
jgi:hypothetical protein